MLLTDKMWYAVMFMIVSFACLQTIKTNSGLMMAAAAGRNFEAMQTDKLFHLKT